MSSSDRRKFLILLAGAPLASCGFVPAYGPGGTSDGILGQIRVDPAEDRDGFTLVGRLEERLGRAGTNARYTLAVTLTTEKEAIGITTTNEIDRFNVVGTAFFALRDTADDSIVQSGTVENFTSYSATAATVGTIGAERDALERLTRTLADQIVTRLIAGASSRAS